MKVSGTLRFLTWTQPWLVGGEDVRPSVMAFFHLLNGQGAGQEAEFDSYSLVLDDNSESIFKEETFFLVKDKGMSNVVAHLEEFLQMVNGREVKVEVDEYGLKVNADPNDGVHEIYFVEDNSCEVLPGDEEKICKLGTPDCCIFLTFSGGFRCDKCNSWLARQLLDRLTKGTIRAQRIGNCALRNRKS